MKKVYLLSVLLLLGSSFVMAQAIPVPFLEDRWDTRSGKMVPETYLGKEGILLQSGMIFLKDIDFLDGSIEVDISFPLQRSFPGVLFRAMDTANFEIFYVRPHQSGNPDATQYTPTFNDQASWQLYQGTGYGQPYTFTFNSWHHLRIDVKGLQAEIFLDDMQKPFMKVPELKLDWKAGKIGLMAGGKPVHFANFQYTPGKGASPARQPVPVNGTDGLITQWEVSNIVRGDLFGKPVQLSRDSIPELTWTTRRTDPFGLIDFSAFNKLTKEINTVVAVTRIRSERNQLKLISFGFSDQVTVYVNGVPVYTGSDGFLSRDYRFFGTIGYFDKVFLPLKKGLNEVWFVVSEDFGGWGLKAKFENMDHIRLK